MEITPVQPHNSLNSIILKREINRSFSHREYGKPLDSKASPKNILNPSSRNHFKSKLDNSQLVARKKFNLEQKLQETMRNNNDQKLKSLQEHKEDLMLKKKMLSDILNEYEMISKDKNILTAEINNMKKYLSDIRSKLDQSLSVLNKNTTLFALKRGLTNAIFAPKGSAKPKLKKSKKVVRRKKSSVQNSISGVKLKSSSTT